MGKKEKYLQNIKYRTKDLWRVRINWKDNHINNSQLLDELTLTMIDALDNLTKILESEKQHDN